MIDIDTRIKIEELIKECYDKTYDILFRIENAEKESHVFRTLIVQEDDPTGVHYFRAFVQHYQGVFEGIFTGLFDNDFNRYPSPDEIPFIQEAIQKDWKKLINVAMKFAKLELERERLGIKKD